jgi:hypothetical protein
MTNSAEYAFAREHTSVSLSTLTSTRIARSHTDTNVSYSQQYLSEVTVVYCSKSKLLQAVGSTNYIERNGHLKLLMILQAVNTVIEHQTSARVCEMALNIGDILINMGCLAANNNIKVKCDDEKCPPTATDSTKIGDDYLTPMVQMLMR